MIKKILVIGYWSLIIVVGIYLIWPSPKFPNPPPGSLQSNEFSDTESFYRRGYFTNLSREEIMDYYENNFKNIIQYRLNYPPEEAQSLIRDQIKSSFLEEIIHPGRESLYVNGFVPVKENDVIYRNGIRYLNKITIRYVPSHLITRLTVLLMTGLVIWITLKNIY